MAKRRKVSNPLALAVLAWLLMGPMHPYELGRRLQETGQDKLNAVIEAAGTRLRPILMTTAATVVGHFPLVIATGPGAGARNSIGTMLVTGMVIGTVFTLFVVPSIYMLLARKRTAVVQAADAAHVPSADLAAEAI